MLGRLKSLATLNGRFAPHLTHRLTTPPNGHEAADFAAYVEAKRFEFTTDWADNNIPYLDPPLRCRQGPDKAPGNWRIRGPQPGPPRLVSACAARCHGD